MNNMIRTAKNTWNVEVEGYAGLLWSDTAEWEHKTLSFIENLNDYQRYGHEVILGTDTTRPLFDIDIGGIEADRSVINRKRKEIIKGLTNELKSFRTKIFALFNTTITFGFADASGMCDNKDTGVKEGFISLRVGINNVKVNWLACKILAKEIFKGAITTYGTTAVDTTIYSNGGQLLRMPYQYKPADKKYKRYFKPLDAEPTLFIAQVYDTDWIDLTEWCEQLANPLPNTLSLPTPADGLLNPLTMTREGSRVCEVKHLLDCLNPDCSRQEWSKIRWALSNIEGKLNYKPLYEEWSKGSTKYNQTFGGVENYAQQQIDLWGVEKGSYNYSYGTLHYLAKEHNPEKFHKQLVVRCDNPYGLSLAIASGNWTKAGLLPNEIAKMFGEYLLRREDMSFVFDGKNWFAFKKGKWRQTGELYIYSFMNDDFCPMLSIQANAMREFIGEAEHTLDAEELKQISLNPAIAQATKSYLGDPLHKDKVIKELRALYHKPMFHQEVLDCDRWLIGFDNGVYDLRNHEFRQAVEGDYISKSVGYEYDPHTNTADTMRDIDIFFDNMFIGVGERKVEEEQKKLYVKSWLAWSVCGAMPDGFNPPFIALTGVGSNGKSKIIEFMGKILGEHDGGYTGNFDEKTFTGDDDGGGEAHKTQLYKNIKRRFVFFTEPKSHSSKGKLIHLNSNKIKSYTSDLQSCRPAHARAEETIEMKVHFNLWATLNTMPKIDDRTQGTRRRFKEVVMKSQFLEQKDYAKSKENKTLMPHQFVMDSAVEENIEIWGQSCGGFHYLMRQLKEIQKDKHKYLDEPECIHADTQDLFDGQDFFGAYVRSMLCKGEEWEVVRLQDLIDWCKGKEEKPEEDNKVYQGVMGASTKEVGTGQGIKDALKTAVEGNFGLKITQRFQKYKKDEYADGLRSVFVGLKWKYGEHHYQENLKHRSGRSTRVVWVKSPIKEFTKAEGMGSSGGSSTNKLLESGSMLESDSEEEALTAEQVVSQNKKDKDVADGVCSIEKCRWVSWKLSDKPTLYYSLEIQNPVISQDGGKKVSRCFCGGCGTDLLLKPCYKCEKIAMKRVAFNNPIEDYNRLIGLPTKYDGVDITPRYTNKQKLIIPTKYLPTDNQYELFERGDGI